ncbi:hypothetical protein ACFPRL_15960 [Pseudoclavibacter helvolus]
MTTRSSSAAARSAHTASSAGRTPTSDQRYSTPSAPTRVQLQCSNDAQEPRMRRIRVYCTEVGQPQTGQPSQTSQPGQSGQTYLTGLSASRRRRPALRTPAAQAGGPWCP